MADSTTQLVAELIGEAFLDALRRNKSDAAERLRTAWHWFRNAAQAPPGLRLVSPEGQVYTGLVIVEQNEATLLVALRHVTPSQRHAPEPRGTSSQQWGAPRQYEHSRPFPFAER